MSGVGPFCLNVHNVTFGKKRTVPKIDPSLDGWQGSGNVAMNCSYASIQDTSSNTRHINSSRVVFGYDLHRQTEPMAQNQCVMTAICVNSLRTCRCKLITQ